ncbi:hypothetical protein O3M35_012086 [Rhynocoris fuscipes]|uniref:Uncharacterized protein n=1 Tax=Rhynocoris fuscipes TaxID=488301 RepID=A0AAW1CTN2_9HEMI
MSHFVNLEIVVPEAFIVGATEYHVVLGGTINLVCVIEKVSLKKIIIILCKFVNLNQRTCFI